MSTYPNFQLCLCARLFTNDGMRQQPCQADSKIRAVYQGEFLAKPIRVAHLSNIYIVELIVLCWQWDRWCYTNTHGCLFPFSNALPSNGWSFVCAFVIKKSCSKSFSIALCMHAMIIIEISDCLWAISFITRCFSLSKIEIDISVVYRHHQPIVFVMFCLV